MITVNLVIIVGTAIVTIGSLIPVFELHARSIGKAIINNAKPIATAANDTVQVVESALKLPTLAEMKINLSDAESKP